MPTREEVLRRIGAGEGYEDAGRALGIPAGLAYLIATGLPADGSDSLAPEDYERPGLRLGGYPGAARRAPPQPLRAAQHQRVRARPGPGRRPDARRRHQAVEETT